MRREYQAWQGPFVWGWLALLLLSAAPCQLHAQNEAAEAAAEERDPNAPQYDELAVPPVLDDRGKQKQELAETRRRQQDLTRQVVNVINGSATLAENQKKFDGFFLQFYFPQFTWLDNIENPANYNALYSKRDMFFRQYLRRATLPDVRQALLKITLAKMKEIANGNFHPAARVNAMLIITELNAREMVQTGQATPPDPYIEAFPVMVDALGDAQQLDSVKVAAMLGILRHLQWDSRQRDPRNPQARKLDDAARDRANQLSLALINAKQPPPGRTEDGHAWMQRRAIDILTVIGTLGTDVNATQTVNKMVSDDKAPLSLRISAAEALGQLNLPPETRLDPVETARNLGELAVYVCKRETKRYEDEQAFLEEKRKGAGGMGGMPGGAMMPNMGMMPNAKGGGMIEDGPGGAPGMPGMAGMMPGMAGGAGKAAPPPLDPRLVVAQRRVRGQLHSLKIGLAGVQGRTTGIQGLVQDEKHKAAVQKLVDEVKAIRDLSEDEKIRSVDKFMAEVKTKTVSLEKAMKLVAAQAKPAADPAGAAPADDGPGAAPAKPAAPAKKPAAAAAALPAAKPGDDPAGGGQ